MEMKNAGTRTVPHMDESTRRWSRCAGAVAIGFGVVLASGVAHTVSARSAHEHAGCSNATLHGDYGRLSTGIRIAPANPAVTETFVGTGVRTYDGTGGFTEISSSHGQISSPNWNSPGQGTYIVNPDCTGTAINFIEGAPFPVESSFVIVGHGEQVKHAVMSPQPQVVSSIEDLINR